MAEPTNKTDDIACEFVKSFENISLSENVGGDFPLDEAVIAVLPKGTRVISCDSHGSSAWTRTARLVTNLADGSTKRYFLKCATNPAGRLMMEGEYNSMSTLYSIVPQFVPEPYSWGRFSSLTPEGEETYFFLSAFISMSSKLPQPRQLCTQLADLHKRSISPTGKFGYHMVTCHGRFPQVTHWESSWTKAYANYLKGAMDTARSVNEPWEELDTLSQTVLDVVIPAVLGPLESAGRAVKPSLIHSDLWEGNIGTDYATGQIYIFDSGCFFAHHELEIAMWRCKRSRMGGKVYLKEFLRHASVSEPVEMFEDRQRLYNLAFNFWHVAHHPGSAPRVEVFEDMSYLVDKFASTERKSINVEAESQESTKLLGKVEGSAPEELVSRGPGSQKAGWRDRRLEHTMVLLYCFILFQWRHDELVSGRAGAPSLTA